MKVKIISALLLFVVIVFATPKTISFQGKLLEGGVLVDGTRNIHFYLYDVETGGSSIWDENHIGVTVADGLFNVELGGATSFESEGLDFSDQYWLTFSVSGGAEISPRYKLNAAPYAITDGDWTISGSDMYSAVSGNVGIGTTSPTGKLHIESASANAIEIDSPVSDGLNIRNVGDDGIEIDSAYYYGLWVKHSGSYGVYIQSPHSDGIRITYPDGDGIDVWGAERGINIISPDTGIVVSNSVSHGISVNSAGTNGLQVYEPGNDGVHIVNPENDGVSITIPDVDGVDVAGGVRGMYIHPPLGTGSPDTGIVIRAPGTHGMYIDSPLEYGMYIDSPGSYGLFIDSPLDDGINIAWPTGDGIEIRGGGDTEYGIVIHDNFGVGDPDRGILIEDVADCGILINSPGTHGMVINNADSHGVQIGHPEHSGIEVLYAGYAGAFIQYPTYKGVVVLYPGVDCYGCTSSRYRRFRVNSECEVFGRSYNQYIVDEEGLGIATPVSATTERWLVHIGESQLSDGECRVDLPQDFLEGVTITKDFPMQVFVTPYGDLGRYTIERHTTYFIVRQIEGDPNASFAYKVHAKVRGGENDAILHVDLKAEQEEEERLMGGN